MLQQDVHHAIHLRAIAISSTLCPHHYVQTTLCLHHVRHITNIKTTLKHLRNLLSHLRQRHLTQVTTATSTCTATVAHLACQLSKAIQTILALQLSKLTTQLVQQRLRIGIGPSADVLALRIAPRRLPRRAVVLDQNMR